MLKFILNELPRSAQVKEALCYVSGEFMSELQAARVASKPGRPALSHTAAASGNSGGNTAGTGEGTGKTGAEGKRAPARDHLGGALKKQFVLPDFQTVMKGYVKPDDEPSDAKEQVRGRWPVIVVCQDVAM